MKRFSLVLVSFALFCAFNTKKFVGENADFQPSTIDKSICSNASFPVNGWEFISNDVDNGTNGVMGRTTCIFVDEQNDPSLNTVYVGTENSGLWKTENFNDKMPEWRCLTKASRLPGIGVVDVDIDPRNADNIYIATAIGVSFEWSYGLSVLRTTDGGLNWEESNLSKGGTKMSESIAQRIKIVKSRRFGKEHLVALCDKTVFKSKDGGENFFKVGALKDFEEGNSNYFLNDLVIHPENKNVLYASSVDQFLENGGSRILLSRDSGDSWTDVSSVLSDNFNETNSTTDFIRLDIATTPSKPQLVYAYGVTKGRERKLYVIDFSEIEKPKTTIYTNKQSIGSYWMCDIEVSRLNPNRVYLGRVSSRVFDLSQASDGEIRVLGHANSGAIHSDKRDYFIVGDENEERLYCANDGGVALYAKNAEGKYQWVNKTGKGLGITQFYGLGVSVKQNTIAGGAQDLGGFLYGKEFKNYRCGDGYQSEIDEVNNKIYISFNSKVAVYPTNVFCGKTGMPIGRNDCKFEIGENGILIGAGFATGSTGDQMLKKGRRGNFIYFYNPITEQYTEIKNYPYTGENAQIGKQEFESGLQRISALAISNSNKKVFYVAGNRKEANKNRFWRVALDDDFNATWTNMGATLKHTQGRLAPWQIWQSMSALAVNTENENGLWIGFSDNLEKGRHKVAYHPNTLDATENAKWIFLDEGLPNFPINHLEQDVQTGYLYAATDVGMYINRNPTDANSDWECFNKGLPVVKVTDIELDTGEIFISTYGRGLWKAACFK